MKYWKTKQKHWNARSICEKLKTKSLHDVWCSFSLFFMWFARFQRSIFQIFWKPHCCPNFLFLKLGISDLHHRPSFEQGFWIWTCTVVNWGIVTDLWQLYYYCKSQKVFIIFKFKILGQNRVYGEDLRSLTSKTKNRGNNVVSRRFASYSF